MIVLRQVSLVIIIIFVLSVFLGCAPEKVIVKTKLDQFFENSFEGFEVPDVAKIKEDGESKNFPYATFDEVWDATILVLMQQGFIVRSSKDKGFIVIIDDLPRIVFLERGDIVTVYLSWMDGLERCPSSLLEEKNSIIANFYKSNIMTKIFFDKLSTQVYAKEKWKWLKVKTEE